MVMIPEIQVIREYQEIKSHGHAMNMLVMIVILAAAVQAQHDYVCSWQAGMQNVSREIYEIMMLSHRG